VPACRHIFRYYAEGSLRTNNQFNNFASETGLIYSNNRQVHANQILRSRLNLKGEISIKSTNTTVPGNENRMLMVEYTTGLTLTNEQMKR
jgi:hypothetical protein